MYLFAFDTYVDTVLQKKSHDAEMNNNGIIIIIYYYRITNKSINDTLGRKEGWLIVY